MKILLVFLMLLPVAALAQSAAIPVMGTAPAQSVATQPLLPPATKKKARMIRKKTAPFVQVLPQPVKPAVVTIPPPSQVTRDFYKAFTNDNLQLAEMLLQQGADINCRNCGEYTLLANTAYSGTTSDGTVLMRWLLAHGANVNEFNLDEKTNPLIEAINHRNSNGIYFLLKNGANPNIRTIDGDSPMLLQGKKAYRITPEYFVPILDALIGAGAEINQVDNKGYSPLMISIEFSEYCPQKIVEAYLRHGASVDIRAKDGMAAVDLVYKKALMGEQSCNEVYATLKSHKPGPRPIAAEVINPIPVSVKPAVMVAQPVMAASILTGEWQGVFNSTQPRQGSVAVTGVFSRSGEVIFSSQSGLRGSGSLNVTGDQVAGSFVAKSPLDAQGRPVFSNPDGSTDILFTLEGSHANGVMRGKYTSAIESGNFVMCDDANYQQNSACRVVQVQSRDDPADLLQAVGGLLGALKGLTGK